MQGKMRQNEVLNAAKRKTKKHKNTLQWYKQNLFEALNIGLKGQNSH